MAGFVGSLLSQLDFSTCIVVFVIFFITYNYMTSRRARNLPPGPLAYPIFGNIPYCQKRKQTIHKDLIDPKTGYGDVASLYMGNVLVVIFNTYKTIKETLIDQPDVFSDRSELITEAIYRDHPVSPGIIQSSGERWKTIRKAIVVALRDMGVGKKSIEDKISEEACYIIDELQKHESKPIDMKMPITWAVSNVINGVVFGERFEFTDERFNRTVEIMMEMFSLLPFAETTLYSPLLSILYTREYSQGSKIVSMGEEVVKFYQSKIQEHRDTFNKDEMRDVIDICIAADIEDTQDAIFSAKTVVGVVDDLFNAGTETTNTTLRWLFLQMIRYPEIQEKCFRELEEVFGDERPSAKERSKCHYINATINENQRLSNIIPLGLIHTANQDTVVGGYNIPKGTLVSYNMYAVHMDDKNFTDAKSFKPERWLDEDGNFKKLDKVIPFGAGRRACAGEHLAKIELFIFFTILLQKYRFEAPKGVASPKDEEGHLGITFVPPDYNVVPIRR